MSNVVNENSFQAVKVLYDYNYIDTDSGEDIFMYVDEEFILLHQTNEDWWEVCRQKDNTPFFVPAQYVMIIEKKKDENYNTEDTKRVEPTAVNTDIDNPSVQADESTEQTTIHPSIPKSEVTYANNEPEVTYANLEDFRAASNISEPPKSIPQPPSKSSQNLAEEDSSAGEYANLAFIQSFIHPPSPEQGEYVQVLLEPLPWDIYKDRYSGRWFYHNRETNECMWKPPRKCKSPASPLPEKFGENVPDSKTSTDSSIKLSVSSDEDDVACIHKNSKEKQKKAVDADDKECYINLVNGETIQELPTKTDKTVNFSSKVKEPANGVDSTETVTNKSYTSLPRSSKSMSLYGNESSFIQDLQQQLSKSATLPPNFSPAAGIQGQLSIPTVTIDSGDKVQPVSGNSTTLIQTAPIYRTELNRHLAGNLMISKISEVGKKVKKNWVQAYLVLKQSNLVFYKDEKAFSQKQPGSPHGKTELVLNLQGAKIDINPKDITSKRNVILILAVNGNKVLLQSNEETIYRWFTEMKLVSGDLEVQQKRLSFKEEKKGVTRSISTDDGSSGRNLWSIRSKLLSLMRSRPAQEDLVKRGIIKDSIFGSRLKDLCDKENTKVPIFVRLCITAVEKRGLDHDGIYRISGNLAEIQRLRYCVDKAESYDLDDKQWDMNVLTGSLKLFFRELKEPLIPPDMFDRFSAAVRKDSAKDKLKATKEIIPDLPKCNYETLKVLLQHLIMVVKESKQNRMQAHNLAIVFGPTLSWKDDSDASNMAVLTVYQSRIVEFMLLEFENLFK